MSTMTTPQEVRTRSLRRPRWRRVIRRDGREWLLFGLFLFPNVVLLAVFNYWPVIQSVILSLKSWNFQSPPVWVGVQNYLDLVSDPEFHQVLLNTLEYAGTIIVGVMIIGLALGVLFNQRLIGSGLARTVAFAPHIITGSALATLWLFILDPRYGLLSALLTPLGINSPDWVNSPTWSLWSLVIEGVWTRIGFTAIIFLAGLQSMPKDVFEAAKLDGAGTWTTFRRFTLPLLSPVTLFLLIITTMHSFRSYDVTALMTNGGPGVSSTTLPWYIYQTAFANFDIGHATAASLLMFVVLIAIAFLQMGLSRRWVFYQ